VLTAGHVIKSINPGEESDVETPDGELHAINTRNMQTFGEKWDLAVVEFTSDKNYQVGKFGDSSTLKRGKTVYVAGFPIATGAINIPILTFTKGEVTAVTSRPLDDGYGLVYDNTTLPGMSGGVVLDENGKIVGVHGRANAEETKATDDPSIRVKTGFNLAIPINSYLGLTNQIAFNPDANVDSALSADDYFAQAGQKYEEGDYQGAIPLLNQAIAINPQYAYAYAGRGYIYYFLQKYQEAIADYTKAIAINPQYAEAYYNRGATYYYLQRYQEAIADYTQAIAINPQYAEAYYNRGATYYYLQRYQEAIADYTQAIAINPQYAGAYGNRGATYYYLQRYQEAIADYTKAIAINPQYAGAYGNRGVAYYYLQRYQEAIADYTQAIKINPQYAEAYYNRGATYDDLQRYQEARRDLQQAANLFRQQGNNDMYQTLIELLNQLPR
jgi:tetratricopeptide (TPR) repeat protein